MNSVVAHYFPDKETLRRAILDGKIYAQSHEEACKLVNNFKLTHGEIDGVFKANAVAAMLSKRKPVRAKPRIKFYNTQELFDNLFVYRKNWRDIARVTAVDRSSGGSTRVESILYCVSLPTEGEQTSSIEYGKFCRDFKLIEGSHNSMSLEVCRKLLLKRSARSLPSRI